MGIELMDIVMHSENSKFLGNKIYEMCVRFTK